MATLFPNFAADFEQLARYDEASGSFAHYLGLDPKFDDFSSFQYGEGYQLYCSSCTPQNPLTISFTGLVPTSLLPTSLSPGWQLLSSITTGAKNETVSQVFGSLATGRILRYDPSNGSLTSVQASTPVAVGESFYVEVLQASTWTPPLPVDVTTTTTYDGDGGRTKLTTAAGTTTFLGESVEIDPAGKTTKYVFAGSQRIAALTSSLQPGASSLQFYHGDHLGSSNVITDATGQVVELAEYTPYGSLSLSQGATTVAHKFTGQRLDTSTGLYYYHARYYDPQLGRFTQPDTIVQAPGDPQSLNRYSYARNNPVKFVDPSGHFFWFFAFLFAALKFAITTAVSFLASAAWGIASGLQAAVGVWSSFAVAHPIITGALVGGFQGGYSAHQAGGNVFAGIAFGATAGALGGYLGGQFAGLAPGGVIGQATLQGALTGAGSGAATGFAGGKGSLSDVAKGMGVGALQGGTSALVFSTVDLLAGWTTAFGETVNTVQTSGLSPAQIQQTTKTLRAAQAALSVKPAAVLIGAAAGAGIASAASGGNRTATWAGALAGGVFGAVTSGVRPLFLPMSDISLNPLEGSFIYGV